MRRKITLLILIIAVFIVNASTVWAYSLLRMYGPHGEVVKWKGQSPEVQYRINMSGHSLNPSVPVNTAIEEFKTAMAAWSTVPTASFKFVYAGTSNLGSGWDGVNNINWSNMGNIGVVAYNVSTYNWNAEMLESDIVFNSSYPFHINGSQNVFDLQNVAAHELGHSVPLGDLYGMDHLEKTMFGVVGMGETKKRTLDQDDIDGITFLYPKAAQPECTYSLSHTNKDFTASGGSDNIVVTTPAGCTWSVQGNPGWITIASGANNNQSGAVSYTVAGNTSTSERTAIMNIAGKLFTVKQSGNPVTGGIITSVNSLDFGNVKTRTQVIKTFTVTNTSSSRLTISLMRTGKDALDFLTGLSTKVLNPGASATVTVIFTPRSVGEKNASVIILTGNKNIQPQISLKGKGI